MKRRRSPLLLVAMVFALGCVHRDDDYLLLRREAARAEGAPTKLRFASREDPEAAQVRRLLAGGFGAELLRTHAMTKRFVDRTASAANAKANANAPTVVGLGVSDVHVDRCRQVGYRDRVVAAMWLEQRVPAEAPVVWAEADPWPSLVRGLGGAIVDLISPEDVSVTGCSPLRDGYVAFLGVVAAEWRDPAGLDDHPERRRDATFAAVRGDAAPPATAQQAATDPLVIATVLYRMAASELGRRMAPDDLYRPFLESQPSRGIPPALLLGAFRNFQAKLISAWSRAVAAGRPPRDLVDLVEAYGEAHPAERAEATRIFLVTTYGATALSRPIVRDGDPDAVAAQLAAVTADVLFGRVDLRGARTSRRRGI